MIAEPSQQNSYQRQKCTTAGKVRIYRLLSLQYPSCPAADRRLPTGQSQFLTSPILAKPIKFSSLTLDDHEYDQELTKGIADSDTRLMEMMQAQAQNHGGQTFEDVNAVADDDKLQDEEKKTMLQKALNMSASNGDLAQVSKILTGKAKTFVDVNAPDEDGTPPLVYASCFVSNTTYINNPTLADSVVYRDTRASFRPLLTPAWM
jgi:hypothetical protein